jgi:hypothetical protein
MVVHLSSPTLVERRHPLFLYGEFRHFLISTVAKYPDRASPPWGILCLVILYILIIYASSSTRKLAESMP